MHHVNVILALDHPTILEACARSAHDVNRAYCLALGDASQVSWDEAPDWQKESARAGVEGALRGNTPEQSHEAWFAHKQREGWVLGPVKDPVTKEHPCLVPYAELPPAQRFKDHLFVTTVRQMAEVLLVVGQVQDELARVAGVGAPEG